MTVATSDFQAADPHSAWFAFQQGSAIKVLLTNGKSFVSIVQSALKYSQELANRVRTYDNTMIRGTDVTVDGSWGPKTYKALWALIQVRGGGTLLDTVRAAATAPGRTIPENVMNIAVRLILPALRVTGTIDGVSFPPGTIYPRYGAAGPGVRSLTPLVRDATAEEIAAVGGTSSGTDATSSTPIADTSGISATDAAWLAAQPATGETRTDTGKFGTTTQLPGTGIVGPSPVTPSTPTGPLPTGVTPGSVNTGSGISWGPIAVVGGVIAVLAVLGITLMKSAPAASAPAMRPAPVRRRSRR